MTFSKVFPCASSFGTTKHGTGSLVYGDGLRSNGSIASSLDDEIYAGWTGKAISVSDSQTIYLPISVSDTIAGTGSLTQDVAQAGTTYYPGAVEETDEELPIVDVPVVGADLLGIITLLKEFLNMNFQNVRLRPLLCAVLSVILVTGSMILPAFAAEQNVNFSYVDSVPSATVAPALWKVAGCSESLPVSSAQMVLNERVGAAVDGYISSDKKAFILNHDYLDMFLQSHDELSTTHNILGWQPTESYTGGEGEYFAVPIDTSGLTYDPDSAESFVFHSAAAPEPEPTAPAQEPSTPDLTADLAKIVSSENLSSVFDEVKSLLPVVCAVIVGYIGLRKGISFLQSVLHSA